jgi:hypothetical protein
VLKRIVRLGGVTVEQLRPGFAETRLQAKVQFASLYGAVNYGYHCLVNFTLAGKKTFHFSDNLAEHLANTEINLKASRIQLPFATCPFALTIARCGAHPVLSLALSNRVTSSRPCRSPRVQRCRRAVAPRANACARAGRTRSRRELCYRPWCYPVFASRSSAQAPVVPTSSISWLLRNCRSCPVHDRFHRPR